MLLPVAIALAVAATTVPLSRVAACDCALIELADAVQEADVAFAGTLVGQEPGGDRRGIPPVDTWHWSVERSRDSGSPATMTVMAAEDDGANCGVPFAMGERWLVLASVHEGVLQTNGCQPNLRLDGAPEDAHAMSTELLPHTAAGASGDAGLIPLPVIVAAGATAVLALIGVVAFRADRRRG